MRRLALMLAMLSPQAVHALEFGEWTTPGGSVIIVEEDFMDARYPRHLIILAPAGGTERDGALVLRCEQNRTEVYFNSGMFDFFGHGSEPQVAVRFPSDDRASVLSVGLSTDAEAVFFDNPIGFLSRLAADGSVGLDGNYYGGSFRHNFVLDAQLTAALRDLAATCEWADRLPARPEAAPEPAPDQTPPAPGADASDALSAAIRALVGQYGADAVRAALHAEIPPPAK